MTSWAKEMKQQASDQNSVMRIHALSLLCFADGIDQEIAEAIQKGGHVRYTIEVAEDADKKGERK